jgi:hypothetical protein
MDYNPYQLHPVLTAEGKPWVQRCYVCDKSIDFIRMPSVSWVRVGEMVRHKRCYPGIPKEK